MIVSINGWPGVGKLTVGRVLAQRMNGRLLDNHRILDLATVASEPGTDSFYETVRALRKIVFHSLLALPLDVPIVLTNVVARGGGSEENWEAVLELAAQRHCRLFAVRLTCSPSEHNRRLIQPVRLERGKMGDLNYSKTVPILPMSSTTPI